jgi:hypothetical protein
MTFSPATPAAAAANNVQRRTKTCIFMGSLAISCGMSMIVCAIGFVGQPGPPKDKSDAGAIALMLLAWFCALTTAIFAAATHPILRTCLPGCLAAACLLAASVKLALWPASADQSGVSGSWEIFLILAFLCAVVLLEVTTRVLTRGGTRLDTRSESRGEAEAGTKG